MRYILLSMLLLLAGACGDPAPADRTALQRTAAAPPDDMSLPPSPEPCLLSRAELAERVGQALAEDANPYAPCWFEFEGGTTVVIEVQPEGLLSSFDRYRQGAVTGLGDGAWVLAPSTGLDREGYTNLLVHQRGKRIFRVMAPEGLSQGLAEAILEKP